MLTIGTVVRISQDFECSDAGVVTRVKSGDLGVIRSTDCDLYQVEMLTGDYKGMITDVDRDGAAVPVAIHTACGGITGTLRECAEWQAEHQGAFAVFTIGMAGVDIDVDDIDFDIEDIDATVDRLRRRVSSAYTIEIETREDSGAPLRTYSVYEERGGEQYLVGTFGSLVEARNFCRKP
jgi:hypothetical protein